MKTIIFKQVHHITSDELRHMIRVDVLGKNYDDDEFNEIYLDNTNYQNDHIKIDTLRKYLDNIEKKGANYVAIDFHIDHGEYEIDGVQVRLATKYEIEEHEEKDKQLRLKQAKERVMVLNSELSKFQKLVDELSKE